MGDHDYRELLKKYMKHVGYMEGVCFVKRCPKSPWFSDAEWYTLNQIDDELMNEEE